MECQAPNISPIDKAFGDRASDEPGRAGDQHCGPVPRHAEIVIEVESRPVYSIKP